MELKDYLNASYTAYQAVQGAKSLLLSSGFVPLKETESWHLERGGKYFVERNGSSLIAFCVGTPDYFKIVASHTDSPCLKLKENPAMERDAFVKWNVEPYGGGIWYSFFDRPLKVAGRIAVKEGKGIRMENVVSPYTLTIPSLAVHMNRGVNDGFSVNPQIDLLPLAALGACDLFSGLTSEEVFSYDLYVVPAEAAYESGVHGEFLTAPRLDNLTSVFSSLLALTEAEGDGICVAALFDNEEVGSRTLQGAGSDFLRRTLNKIGRCLGISVEVYAKSYFVSLDNAHSVHPNHPEKCDPTNRPVLGGGVVIKNHANKAYTTDALSSAIAKLIFERAGVKYQLFFNRSDARSGGTLGAISQGQISVPTVDMGIAQLAMHSAVETMASSDFEHLLKGLKAIYSASIRIDGDKIVVE